ncbi:MAG TPA: choice-of-anchor P family protein [Acidisarcina sp.]|nr:choice-of-anchor P family protein [Acidisarcina sp.]
MEASKRVHYYHADASSFGGVLEHPVKKVVPSQAAVSLPAAGGYTSTRSGAFNFEEIASCGGAFTHASGGMSLKNGAWTTLVTSAVENLNILEVVTADRVVAQISIEHPVEGHDPKVTFVGSHFQNLRIGGVPVEPAMNLGLLTPETGYPGCPWTRHEGFLKRVRDQHHQRTKGKKVPAWAVERYAWVESQQGIEERGHVVCSLVDSLKGEIPGKTFGHVVEIEEFGRFFFGEVVVAQGGFQLTMVRAELGCAVHGSLGVASARGNGHTYP